MERKELSDEDISSIETLLLPIKCHFDDDAKKVINFWKSTDVSACPGSGKTTVLLAKLKILADNMPLPNGAGICVLSHTNVAVNEIRTKLTDCAFKLMNYPNYVGTIQSFIDRYVVIPYMRTLTDAVIRVVDDKTYAEHLYQVLWNNPNKSSPYHALRWLIRYRAKNRNIDDYAYIKDISLSKGALYYKGEAKSIAGKQSPSALQYDMAVKELLENEGIIRYVDAFKYTEEAIKKLNKQYTNLFAKRFQYVFIDEFQDCSDIQKNALNKLFNDELSCVFHIGDPDQAIYNLGNNKCEDWNPNSECLEIASSNRYGQEIADVISQLKKDKTLIKSIKGYTGYTPTVIVFDESTIGEVIPTYIRLLNEYGLTDEKGIYKVVGLVKKEDLKGLKIGSYWDGFIANDVSKNEYNYWSYIFQITEELKQEKLYLVGKEIIKLIQRVLHYGEFYDTHTNKEYTYITLKKKIFEDYFDVFTDTILQLVKLKDYDFDSIDQKIRILINSIVGYEDNDILDEMPSFFKEKGNFDREMKSNLNCFIEEKHGRTIQLDTVHGVKGETHDATLYLETEKSRSSDIKRILPYFGIGKLGKGQDVEQSRKCVYVGMSRPRKLLCVAVKKDTYEKGIKLFEKWNVVKCL